MVANNFCKNGSNPFAPVCLYLVPVPVAVPVPFIVPFPLLHDRDSESTKLVRGPLHEEDTDDTYLTADEGEFEEDHVSVKASDSGKENFHEETNGLNKDDSSVGDSNTDEFDAEDEDLTLLKQKIQADDWTLLKHKIQSEDRDWKTGMNLTGNTDEFDAEDEDLTLLKQKIQADDLTLLKQKIQSEDRDWTTDMNLTGNTDEFDAEDEDLTLLKQKIQAEDLTLLMQKTQIDDLTLLKQKIQADDLTLVKQKIHSEDRDWKTDMNLTDVKQRILNHQSVNRELQSNFPAPCRPMAPFDLRLTDDQGGESIDTQNIDLHRENPFHRFDLSGATLFGTMGNKKEGDDSGNPSSESDTAADEAAAVYVQHRQGMDVCRVNSDGITSDDGAAETYNNPEHGNTSLPASKFENTGRAERTGKSDNDMTQTEPSESELIEGQSAGAVKDPLWDVLQNRSKTSKCSTDNDTICEQSCIRDSGSSPLNITEFKAKHGDMATNYSEDLLALDGEYDSVQGMSGDTLVQDNHQMGYLPDICADSEADAFITSRTNHISSSQMTQVEFNNMATNYIPNQQLVDAQRNKAVGTTSEGESSDPSGPINANRSLNSRGNMGVTRHVACQGLMAVNVNLTSQDHMQNETIFEIQGRSTVGSPPRSQDRLILSKGFGNEQTSTLRNQSDGANGNIRRSTESEQVLISQTSVQDKALNMNNKLQPNYTAPVNRQVNQMRTNESHNIETGRSPVNSVSPVRSSYVPDDSIQTDHQREEIPRSYDAPPPENANEILFVYHPEAEMWTERNLVNRLREMRASIKISLIHRLYSGGKTQEELAVTSLRKCNHVVIVLSRQFPTCELSSYILGYVVRSFKDKLLVLKSEPCDAPYIVAHLKILALDSPNFWRMLVAGIDKDLPQRTEDWKQPWMFRGQDPFLLVKSKPQNPIHPHLQQRITVPSTPDRRNDHRVVFLVNLAGRESLRPYDHSHDCAECPTYRVKVGDIKVFRYLRDSTIGTAEREVERCVKCWEDKYRQPDCEEALSNEIAFWIRLQNPPSAHRIKALVPFELHMTEPRSADAQTVHSVTIELETKPLKPKQPKKQLFKRRPGNQGDDEFGNEHYGPRISAEGGRWSPPGRSNIGESRNQHSGTSRNREVSSGHTAMAHDQVTRSTQPMSLTGVQESGEDQSLTYDLNGLDLEQGKTHPEKKKVTFAESTFASSKVLELGHSYCSGDNDGASGQSPRDGTAGLDATECQARWPNSTRDNERNVKTEDEKVEHLDGYIYTPGVKGRRAMPKVKSNETVMEQLLGGLFGEGGAKPKHSNPSYDQGQHSKKKIRKTARKFTREYEQSQSENYNPSLDTAREYRFPQHLSCPPPVNPRSGPPETVTREELEAIEEEELMERRRGPEYDRFYTEEAWRQAPAADKQLDLSLPRAKAGGLLTSKKYHDLVFDLEQLGEKSKDPGIYQQFIEKADFYLNRYKSKIRTDEKIIITLKKCGVEHYLNNLKDASEHVRTALQLLPKAKYQNQLEARTYYYISTIYREKKKFGKAKHWIKKAKDCLQHVEKGEDTAKTYYNEGRLYMRMLMTSARNEDYREQAIQCFKTSMEHATYDFQQHDARLDTKLVRRCLLNMARILVDLPETEIGLARDIVTHENLLEAEDCIKQIKNPMYNHNMSQRSHVQLHLAEAGVSFRRARMFCGMNQLSKAESLIGDAVLKTRSALLIAQTEKFKEARIAQDFMKTLTSDHIYLVGNVKTDWFIHRNKLESCTSSDLTTDGAGQNRRQTFAPYPDFSSDDPTGSSAASDVH